MKSIIHEPQESFWSVIHCGGIYGFLLILRTIIYLVLARGRADANAYATVDSTAVFFIIYTLICCYYCFQYFSKNKLPSFLKLIIWGTPVKWLIVYHIVALFSSIWSVNPVLSGYRAVECFSLIGIIVICFYTLYQKGGFEMLVSWVLRYTVICTLIRACWRIPYWSIFFMASQMDATIFFYLAFFCEKNKIIRWIFYLFSILSKSTTAYIGIALGLCGGILDKGGKKIYIYLIYLFIIIAILFAGGKKLIKNTVFSQRSEISLEQTSGRDKMWKRSWAAFYKRPIEGYGFFAGEAYVMRDDNVGAGVVNAHNSISSAILGTGIIGLIPLLLFFLQSFRIVLSSKISSEYRGALVGCFCVAFLHCMGNPGIGSRVYGSWISAVMFFVLLSFCSLHQKGEIT